MGSDVVRTRGRITLGIVDDFAIVLEALRVWLERNAPDVEVVACSSTFREFATDAAFPPDVTLIGELRHESTTIASRIRGCVAAGSRVVIVADDRAVDHQQALQAGAVATFPRKTPMLEIVQAIRRASQSHAPVVRRPAPIERPRLSPGERQALTYYVQGYSTQQVATAMSVKYETAKTFLRRVRQKYAAVDRAAGKRSDLIVRATEDGIL